MPALAQSDVASALERCAEMRVDSERLACFDRLTGIEPDASSADEGGETGAMPPAEVAGAAVVGATPQSRPPEPARPVAARAEEAATAARDVQAQPEPLEERDVPETVTVVAMRKNLSGFTVFETETAEQWVQTDLTNRRYPPTPFSARVESAFLHGYFLRVEDGGIRIRVRRVQ